MPKKRNKSRCHTKRRAGAATHARPSFGMTTTQEIRDLFARCHPIWQVCPAFTWSSYPGSSHTVMTVALYGRQLSPCINTGEQGSFTLGYLPIHRHSHASIQGTRQLQECQTHETLSFWYYWPG